MMRVDLDLAVAAYLFDTKDPTRQQLQRIVRLIDDVNKHYEERISQIDSGVARAMDFSLFAERRENDWALLELPGADLGRLEARRFCDLADALKEEGKLL